MKPSIVIAALASLAAALTALKTHRQDKDTKRRFQAAFHPSAARVVIDLPEGTELDVVHLKKYPQSMSEMAVWLS